MSTSYAALLRGINVGGHHKVPMADLKKAFGAIGCTDVETLLASGNVVFSSSEKDAGKLRGAIEKKLHETFGFAVPTLIRPLSEIQRLVDTDPFKGIPVTENTRLYVTFLTEKPTSNLKIPYTSPDTSFRILSVTSGEVCSVLTITPKSRSVDVMSILEKEFGKNVTTRNWNTVQKLLKD